MGEESDLLSNTSANKFMSQTANLTGANYYQVNLINQISAVTEPGAHSCHNFSIGPNDANETCSQISLSNNRSRRAQFHRLLTAGKVDEV